MSYWINKPLPAGSQIVIDHDPVAPCIEIPYPSEFWKRFSALLFLLFYLALLLFVGFFGTYIRTFGRQVDSLLIVWLAMVTAYALRSLYLLDLLASPTIPQTLTLTDWGVYYDSGRPPYVTELIFVGNGVVLKPGPTPESHQHEFSRADLKTLKLSEFRGGNWLTIDQGRERIILARPATDLELEWLYQVLQDRYL